MDEDTVFEVGVCTKRMDDVVGAIHDSKPCSLPSMNVNPREWIKVNIYRCVNS